MWEGGNTMATTQTQRDKVLNYLRTRGGLTVREAMIELNINCLPKRIEELRKMGYPIKMTWISGKNVRYGVYTLEEGFSDIKVNGVQYNNMLDALRAAMPK